MKRIIAVFFIVFSCSLWTYTLAQPLGGKVYFSIFEKKNKLHFKQTVIGKDPAQWYSSELTDSLNEFSISLYETRSDTTTPCKELSVTFDRQCEFTTWPVAEYILVIKKKSSNDSMTIVFKNTEQDRFGIDIHYSPGEYTIDAKQFIESRDKYTLPKKYSGIDLTPADWKKLRKSKGKKNWFCR